MSDTKCVWKSVAAGAVGGLVAAFAMNQFQSLLKAASGQQKSSSQDEDATVKTAKAISQTFFAHELTDDQKKWAGPAVHYSLGASLGAVYGALAETAPLATAGAGTAYGTAVWFGADEIAVPAFGLSKGPAEFPLSTHLSALASHLVFGVVTGLTRRLILRA
jgi:putative membrane protein